LKSRSYSRITLGTRPNEAGNRPSKGACRLRQSFRRHRFLGVVFVVALVAALVGGLLAANRYIVRPAVPFLLSRLGMPTASVQLADLMSSVRDIPDVRSVQNLHEGPSDLWVGTVDGYADVVLNNDLSVGRVSNAVESIAAAMRREQRDYAQLHATVIFGKARVSLAPDDALNVPRLNTAFKLAKDPLLRKVSITWRIEGDSPNLDANNTNLRMIAALSRDSTVSLTDAWHHLAPTASMLTPNGELVIERDKTTTKRAGWPRVGSGVISGLESVRFHLGEKLPQTVLDWATNVGEDSRVLGYSLSESGGTFVALVGVRNSSELRSIDRDLSNPPAGTPIAITYYSPESDKTPLPVQ
jgi:hypothetical protein